jgi:hypothetical protein
MERRWPFYLAAALAFAFVAALAQPTFASDQISGLVIDYGDGRVTFASVPVGDSEISGIELLEQSGVPLVTVDFGGLGSGVCSLGGQGCSVTTCRRTVCQTGGNDSPFWKYFQYVDGTWQVSPLGASAIKVQAGSINGWSWTSDQPNLPSVDLDYINQMAGTLDVSGEASFTTYLNGEVYREAENSKQSWITIVIALSAIALLLGATLRKVVLTRNARS